MSTILREYSHNDQEETRMFLKYVVAASLSLFSFAANAHVDTSSSDFARPELGDQFRESLLKTKKWQRNSMLSLRTIYCTQWQEMKKMIDIESKGKDSIDTYQELDSCDMRCLTFWPEKIRMQFTFHTGEQLLAVQALQSDLMSTIYVFLKPERGIRKPNPYVKIDLRRGIASPALTPAGTCN